MARSFRFCLFSRCDFYFSMFDFKSGNEVVLDQLKLVGKLTVPYTLG